jgi:thiosulfate dehydrogenase [quinone] large subunit
VLAWKTAGWWGLDRWVLPRLGTPWGGGNAVPLTPRPAR